MGLFGKAHTVRLSTEIDPTEIVRPLDVGPGYYLAMMDIERAQAADRNMTDEERLRQHQLARYEGINGDFNFLLDVVCGLGKIGLEITEDSVNGFYDGTITRVQLLYSAQLTEG